MKILPLSTQDLISLLKSGLDYEKLLPRFKKALQDDEKWEGWVNASTNKD